MRSTQPKKKFVVKTTSDVHVITITLKEAKNVSEFLTPARIKILEVRFKYSINNRTKLK